MFLTGMIINYHEENDDHDHLSNVPPASVLYCPLPSNGDSWTCCPVNTICHHLNCDDDDDDELLLKKK